MCEPVSIAMAMAGTSIATQAMSARATNKASEANAEGVIAQANAQYASRLVQRSIEAANQAREAYSRDLSFQKAQATVNASFAFDGTPKNDIERDLHNSAMDAEWALATASTIRDMKTKEDMSSVFTQAQSAIARLPSVSVAQQMVSAAGSVVGAAAWYQGATSGLEAPSNKSLATAKSGDLDAVIASNKANPITSVDSNTGQFLPKNKSSSLRSNETAYGWNTG